MKGMARDKDTTRVEVHDIHLQRLDSQVKGMTRGRQLVSPHLLKSVK